MSKTSKIIYVGPTITGVATRNTVYDGMPEALARAAKTRPYLSGLCVPLSKMADALGQISKQQGSAYTLFNKALEDSAAIQKGAN